VRLDVRVDRVGISRREQRFRARDREGLGLVHVDATAVVALARVALGVLVRERGADGLHHGPRREVLRGDELDALVLARRLGGDDAGDLGIGLGEGAVQE
jgi:hypothetical protein